MMMFWRCSITWDNTKRYNTFKELPSGRLFKFAITGLSHVTIFLVHVVCVFFVAFVVNCYIPGA